MKIDKSYLRYIEISRKEGLEAIRKNRWTLLPSSGFESIASRVSRTIEFYIETNLDKYKGAAY